MRKTEPAPLIADEVPWSEHVTAYDQTHFVVYAQLLDAEVEGASNDEMAISILAIDPDKDPDRAQRALASHLRRARWMTETGYRDLLLDA